MNDIWEGIGGIFLIGGLIWGGVYLYQNYNPTHTEASGVVKYDDCREKITLSKTDYLQQNGTFICNDTKTTSGKSMGGECVKTSTDSSGKCQTAYIYEKPADETCGTNGSLRTDDKCYCNWGYVNKGGSCISQTQDCQNIYGVNSYASGDGAGGYLCYCSTGSFWNSDKTACVSQYTLNQPCITTYGTGSYSTNENGKQVCDCSYGYSWNVERNSCVTTESINQICVRDVGRNSYYLGNVTNGKYNCSSSY